MTTPKGCRGGIAMGSEMSGGVRDVRIENVELAVSELETVILLTSPLQHY